MLTLLSCLVFLVLVWLIFVLWVDLCLNTICVADLVFFFCNYALQFAFYLIFYENLWRFWNHIMHRTMYSMWKSEELILNMITRRSVQRIIQPFWIKFGWFFGLWILQHQEQGFDFWLPVLPINTFFWLVCKY